MRRLGLVVVFALCGLACASLGTHKTVFDQHALDSVNTIAIGPYDLNPSAMSVHDSVFRAFDTTLIADLVAGKRFQRIVPWDTIKLGIDPNANPIEPELFDWAKGQNLDAILICNLDLYRTTYMFIPMPFDAAVTLRLYGVRSRALIVAVQFNTAQGKSYMLSPGVGGVTHDAAEGAVEALLKSAKRSP